MPRIQLLGPFQQLQWRLICTYMLVTVSAAILIGAMGVSLFVYIVTRYNVPPLMLAHEVAANAAQLARNLESLPPNDSALDNWLHHGIWNTEHGADANMHASPSTAGRTLVVVADIKGNVLACSPREAMRKGTPLAAELSLPEADLVRLVLRSRLPDGCLTTRLPMDSAAAAVPVLGDGSRVMGIVFVRQAAHFHLRYLGPRFVHGALSSAAGIVLFAALVGMGFGFLAARRLIDRLNRIAGAADAWSRGEFSAAAPENSSDELGKLARRLNQMARELQELLTLRQELAMVEERNRLARDLHDTVKQQVFATSMQVGAARALLEHDPPAAKLRLAEAERLAHEVQQELTSILQELRPPANPGKELLPMLREHLAAWSRHNGMEVRMEAGADPPLQPQAEQALFRISQEALANVARHSGATKVLVECALTEESAVLSITDNGHGFQTAVTRPGMGIRNMRERAESLPGGQFSIRSAPGHGTTVEARCLVERQQV